MRNFKKYIEIKKTVKDPFLFLKNARGLGDIIAIIIHSKYLGFFTYLLTGKVEACMKCQKRRIGLNLLVPLNFSKFFYKSDEEKFQTIKNFLKTNVELSNKEIEMILKDIKENENKINNLKNIKILNPNEDEFFKNYKLITEFNNQHENFYITTKIYQKNEQ